LHKNNVASNNEENKILLSAFTLNCW